MYEDKEIVSEFARVSTLIVDKELAKKQLHPRNSGLLESLAKESVQKFQMLPHVHMQANHMLNDKKATVSVVFLFRSEKRTRAHDRSIFTPH
jgi:hypothetical protein